MTTLFIDRKNADIDADGDRVVVRVAGERSGTIPLKPLERIVVQGSATLSTRLLSRLVAQGVGLLILGGWRRGSTATLLGRPGSDIPLRLAQARVLGDEKARTALSRALVIGKIKNQREALRAGEARRGRSLALDRGFAALSAAADGVSAASSRAALRGVEGAAAAAYFAAFTTLFAPGLGFNGRNRRPPRDPVNAALSLGYTLLHLDAVRAAAVEGFDPMVGVYHDLHSGRESLACDLAEPFRGEVDRLVLKMFAEEDLKADGFVRKDGACLLAKAPRRVFYEAYEGAAAGFRPALGRVTRDLAGALRAHAPPEAAALAAPPKEDDEDGA